jgi:predicted nucleic acid-binding protein
MFVLDTNVVSELRRTRPHGAVLAWLNSTPQSDIYVSAATIGEIQAGIEKTREADAFRAHEIERWLVEVVMSINVLVADAETFRIWARFMHKRQSHLWDDAMIAATARQHGAIVVTRNVRDFKSFDVPTLNPFA